MNRQTKPGFSPVGNGSNLEQVDPNLGEFLASFAPQVTQLGFETHTQRRSSVTLAIIAGCLIGLTGYELVKYLSRRREKSQAVQPNLSA